MEKSKFFEFFEAGEGLYESEHSVVVINITQDKDSRAVIVAPKRSVSSLLELTEKEYLDLFLTAKHVISTLESNILGFEYVLLLNKGTEAGQTLRDIHCHIIQTKKGNGFEKIDLDYYIPDILSVTEHSLSAVSDKEFVEVLSKLYTRIEAHEEGKNTPYNIMFDSTPNPNFVSLPGFGRLLFVECIRDDIKPTIRHCTTKFTIPQLILLKKMFEEVSEW